MMDQGYDHDDEFDEEEPTTPFRRIWDEEVTAVLPYETLDQVGRRWLSTQEQLAVVVLDGIEQEAKPS